MKWYQLKSYVNFIFSATNQHGVHSPFVYQLVTKCFYNRKNRPEYRKIGEYRKDVFQEKQQLHIQPNCSTFFKANTYKISKLAKIYAPSWKRSKFLTRLTNYLNCKSVLEIGTQMGIRTSCFASHKNCDVITIDNCEETQKIAREKLKKHHFSTIKFCLQEFTQQEILVDQKKIDCIYIGNTRKKQSTLHLFEEALKKVHNDSVILIEGLHWSKDMNQAWKEIKENKQVSVTIDTFYLGLVFFRKEQAKEHFKIRL